VLRTVTFSDAKVAELVNANFVSAWFNRSPGFCDGDDKAEKSIFGQSHEAFTTKNICTFILTPDGRVFHYVAGYLSPKLFLRFLDDALALRRAGFDDQMKIKPDGAQALQRIHADRAAAREKDARSTEQLYGPAEGSYRGAVHRHNETCTWILAEASRYFARVHRYWEKTSQLPDLQDLRYKYLYGNIFSEEGAGAQKIAVDPAVIVFR